MATYLQGVTDYIPDYQPFQPDYNFYNTVLQAKQTQYDSNWKSLNNVYGAIYNANLTHTDNIEKKDQLLKQIDFNVKRVAGLDLSLEQNVNQAMQVFKPFYEDQYLMKDMAWTKNFTNRYNAAQSLLNSQDEKQRAQYWDTGLKEMMYRREEFKNSTLDQTLNFSDVTYTPYVNSVKKYMDLAKEYGFSVDVSTPPTGNAPYTVRQKNGDLLIPSLQEFFSSTYANDPALQRVYATQAYVNRQDYVQQNLANFNNDRVTAEKNYLAEQYNTLKQQIANAKAESNENLQVTENKLADLSNEYDSGNVNPNSKSYLEKLQEAYGVQKVIDSHNEKLNNEINTGSSTGNTQGPSTDLDLTNLELARLKVDSVYANMLAQEDIMMAAKNYSEIGKVVSYEVDPYYMEKVKDSNARSRIQLAADLKEKKAIEQKGIEEGLYEIDFESSQIVRDANGNPVLASTYQPNGAPTDQEIVTTPSLNLLNLNEDFKTKQRNDVLSSYMTNVVSFLGTYLDKNQATDAEVAGILGVRGRASYLYNQLADITSSPTGPTVESLARVNEILQELETQKMPGKSKYASTVETKQTEKQKINKLVREIKEDPGKALKSLDESGKIFGIQTNFDLFLSKNAGDPKLLTLFNETPFYQNNFKLKEYQLIREANNQIDRDNEAFLTRELSKTVELVINSQEVPSEFPEIATKRTEEGLKADIQKYGTTRLQFPKETIDSLVKYYIKNPNISEEAFLRKFESTVYTSLALAEGGTKMDTPAGEGIAVPLNLQKKLRSKTENILEEVYDNLSKTYNKKVTSPQIKSYQGYKFETGPDGTTAMAVPANGDTVNLKYNVPGNRSFQQMVTDINSAVWNQSGYKITFGQGEDGELFPVTSMSALDLNSNQKQKVIDMLNDIAMKRGTKSKVNPFYIYSIDAAEENPNLSTMKVKLPLEVLNKYLLKAEGGEATGVGYFTADELNAMATQGIGFIAPKSTWSNDLYQRNQTTPWEGVLNANASKTMVYSDPWGAGEFRVKKLSGGGPGDYVINATVRSYLEDGTIVEEEIMNNFYQPQGKSIDQTIIRLKSELTIQSQENIKEFQKFTKQGNRLAIENGQKEFRYRSNTLEFK
jgi:hypothetical protein